MYVCLCNSLTDRQLRAAATAGDTAVCVYRKLGTQPKCGRCLPTAESILLETLAHPGNDSEPVYAAAAE
jgi:bacterioferritin-associated ferredoxin